MNMLVYLEIILGFIFIIILILFAFKYLGRGWSIHQLFKDFNRKICMTVSLGVLFFSIYFLAVWIGSYFVLKWRSDILFFVYQNPLPFIYGGLSLFAALSLTIYLARMIVKYFYLTRGKDR